MSSIKNGHIIEISRHVKELFFYYFAFCNRKYFKIRRLSSNILPKSNHVNTHFIFFFLICVAFGLKTTSAQIDSSKDGGSFEVLPQARRKPHTWQGHTGQSGAWDKNRNSSATHTDTTEAPLNQNQQHCQWCVRQLRNVKTCKKICNQD